METFFVSYKRYYLLVVSSVVLRRFLSHITGITYQLYNLLYGDVFCLIKQVLLTSCTICCMETFFVSYNRYNLPVVQYVAWRRVLSHITGITYQLYYLLYGNVFVSYNMYYLPVVQSVVWRHYLSHITGITYQLYNLLYGDVFCPI